MKKVIIALLALLVVAGAGAGAWWFLNEQHIEAFGGQTFGDGTRVVDIPTGSNPKEFLAQSTVGPISYERMNLSPRTPAPDTRGLAAVRRSARSSYERGGWRDGGGRDCRARR